MRPSSEAIFKRNYEPPLKHLKLKGLQPKTIDAYARAMRRIGEYFDYLSSMNCPKLNSSNISPTWLSSHQSIVD